MHGTFIAYHCANGSSRIQGVDFDQFYGPVTHTHYFRINIAIMDMNRLIARVFDVSNAFHNTNVPINERVCVIIPIYYLYWLERYYPNVTSNQDDGLLCLWCRNGKQITKLYGWQKKFLEALVTILKYKIITIDHVI